MKYLLRTDIKKVSTETTNYIMTPFKRDKSDLSFMTRQDLERYVFEDVFTGEERINSLSDIGIETPYDDLAYNLQAKHIKVLFNSISLERLRDLYSNNSDKTIPYSTSKVSEERYNQLLSKFNDIAQVIEFKSSNSSYVVNNDILFLDNLDRNNIKYTIVC